LHRKILCAIHPADRLGDFDRGAGADPPDEDLKRCSLLKELPPGIKKSLDDAWAPVKGR
jgi:hypothetical protein